MKISIYPRRVDFLAFLLFFAILLPSCGTDAVLPLPPTDSAPPTATFTPSPISEPATTTLLPASAATLPPRIDRVLIVSFDGLRPDAILAAEMENVISLMQSGAYTLTAQTIMPSSTLPSHASMLVGTCPSKHIVRWNEYVPQNGFALGVDLFDLVHNAGLQTVMIVGKEKLRQVTEPSSIDFFALIDETDKIAESGTIKSNAVEQAKRGFNLMFVHFPEGDLKGHEYGWMSVWQLNAYAKNDRVLGAILDALKENGLYESTMVIITSDHGGHDMTHGYNIPDDMLIPWVISGPRVKPGVLTTQVYTMDTAATAAFVLGLPLPAEWDGAPVLEAFGLPITDSSTACQ